MFQKSLFIVLFLFCMGCYGKRKWDYEPISIDPNTSDKEKIDVNVQIKRMPRGEYSYEAYMNVAYDLDETTMVEAKAFRSQSGNDDDYKPVPWSIEKQTWKEFVQGFYNDLVYKNWGGCSNLPAPEEAIVWKRGNYTFHECMVEGDGMPEIAPQGYYKVFFSVTGEVEWGFEAVCRIFDKLMP